MSPDTEITNMTTDEFIHYFEKSGVGREFSTGRGLKPEIAAALKVEPSEIVAGIAEEADDEI